MLIDLGTILVPFLFSFHPLLQFNKHWKAFFSANLLVTAIFVVWDVLFTHLGVWGFNQRYLSGVYVFNLPIEEILFFICIPYASTFTYHCLQKFIHLNTATRGMTIVLVLISLIPGVLFYARLYTSVTCIALAIVLLLFAYRFPPQWLSQFYLGFLIIMLPFFTVNGLLTGSWLAEPVVWYNNNENLGLRLMTIPVEDLFYCLLMLFLNVWFFEKFKESPSCL